MWVEEVGEDGQEMWEDDEGGRGMGYVGRSRKAEIQIRNLGEEGTTEQRKDRRGARKKKGKSE